MMQQLDLAGYGGIRLCADAFGDSANPPVVLVPPSGQTREFWHGAARSLAEAGRFAICIDPRGHGGSDHAPDGRYTLDAYAKDLRAVLAALPSRAVVVGAGLGALTAMIAVGEGAPHLVSGLALVDVNIWFDEAVSERLRDALIARVSGTHAAEDLARAIVAAHPGEPQPVVSERVLAAFQADAEGRLTWRGDPKVFAGSGDIVSHQERLEAAAPRLGVPVTLLRGALNTTISSETIRRLQALIPGAELAEVEGAGHLLGSDTDDAFNAVLLDFLERKSPRQPLDYIGGSEPRILRDALGCFGTGVCVITTVDGEGKPIGLTANSFTSVSLDPPLILFSLARSSFNLDTFVRAGKFAVNVLHIGQQPLSNRFVQRDIDRFEGVDWSIKVEGGCPILGGTLASFDCHTHAVHEGGDHLMFVGHVNHAWFEPHRDPLLYFRGKYRRLHLS